MAIPLLPLDDRKFTDLVDELRALIPRYSKTWTDYNVSDPGIMLTELFAWLTEALLYRINRVPEASRVRLLELLGAVFQPAAPAIIQVTVTDEDLAAPYILPSGARIQAKPTPSSDLILFETMADVKLAPEAPVQTVLARQTIFIEKQTVGAGNGEAHQIIELPQRYLVLPTEALRQSVKAWSNQKLDELMPTVLVDRKPWAYQANYLEMGAAALTYTFEPWRNALRFGNGAHGEKPGAGDRIEIAYYATFGAAGNVPLGTTFAFNPRETGRARLRVEEHFATISLGRNPTGSNDVAAQIFELLHAQWRAITSTDVETVIRANFPEIAQVYCLPGSALDAKAPEANQPGQMGVILAPQPTAQWRADMGRLQEILGLTPNGQRLVARDQEGVVHLWDAQRGEKLTTLGGNLRDLAFSPDGRQIAVVGDDQRLQLWTREPTHSADLFVHPAAVKRVAFDAQGHYRATACADNLVRVWRTATTQVEPAFVFSHAAPVSALAFHPDEACLVSASLDGVAKIWYLNDQEPARLLPCPDHKAAIFAIAFSPNGRYLATAGLDRTVFLWLWPELKLIGAFPHTAAVLDVAFHPQQRQLVAACQNGTAQLWDIESGTVVSLFQHAGPVNAVAIDPTGLYLATASADRTVGLWDLPNAQKVTAIEHNAAVNAVDFYDAQTLATACDDYGVRVWNLADIHNPQCTTPCLTSIQTVNFSPDGRRLIAMTDKQIARLWDTETGAAIVNLATKNPVNKAVFSADSQRLATAHAQQGVHVWDAQQGNLLAHLPTADDVATVDLVFRPDNQQLATVDAQNQVRLWNLTRPPQLVCGPQAPVIQSCFSGDGQRVATITEDGFAHVWNATTGETLFKQPLPLRATTVSLDQDGTCLVTADSHQLIFWDVPKQQVDFTLACEQIQNVTFDAQNLWLAASTQNSVYVLDRKTKEIVATLEHDEPVTTLIFHPNGEQLATVTTDGVVHLWHGPAWGKEKRELPHAAALRSIVFAQNRQQWITFAADQTLYRWDGYTGAFIASSNLAIANVDLVSLSPDGEQIATVVGGTQLRIQAVATGAVVAVIPQAEPVRQLFFHPTLAQLATVNGDAKVYFWSTQPVEPALILPCAAALSDLRFNQDGTRLVIRLADQRAQLWSTRTVAGKPPRLITELGNDVSALAVSPNGQHLATVHETIYITADDPPQPKQPVCLWSTKRGAPEGRLLCDSPVSGLIFSPSNQRLLTLHVAEPTGYTFQLWDLRLKNPLRPLRSGSLAAGKTVLINAAGQWLAQVTERLLHIWDIEQGKQISTLYIDFTDPQVQTNPWLLHYLDPKDNSHQVVPLGSQAPTLTNQLYFTQGKFLLATSGDQPHRVTDPLRPTTNGFSGSANGNGLVTSGDTQAVTSDTQAITARAIEVWNAEHVYAVDHLLDERRLLTTQAHVAGPQYTDVTLTIQVVRKSTAKSITRLQTDVINALAQFFHPLSGGPDGKGWPPGRDVYRSEVYQVIENVAGVDHVASLQFDPPEQDDRVVIPSYQRVNAVVHLEISDSAVSQLWPMPRSSALWLPQRQAVI